MPLSNKVNLGNWITLQSFHHQVDRCIPICAFVEQNDEQFIIDRCTKLHKKCSYYNLKMGN